MAPGVALRGEITNREKPNPPYGRVRTPDELGRLHRAERKRRGLTLEEVYDATALSTRFVSELERGKENASLGRTLRALQSLGLDVLVLPRRRAEQALHYLAQRDDGSEEPEP